eukprot:TRINITY_DN7655_c0_g1_i3.p1 TRINITY_DN7655_c0_g1~~TRINITY_DN7655_c0_g1_i3.p1  ORF type:complete len:224 (+),score=57.07 TRINITY_DN7655_c0_g1_i3:26-697(+)
MERQASSQREAGLAQCTVKSHMYAQSHTQKHIYLPARSLNAYSPPLTVLLPHLPIALACMHACRERLDPALIRPGRVDREFEFKRADIDEIRKLFLRFFRDDALYEGNPAPLERHAQEFADKFRNCSSFSMAQLQGYLMNFIRKENAPLNANEFVELYFDLATGTVVKDAHIHLAQATANVPSNRTRTRTGSGTHPEVLPDLLHKLPASRQASVAEDADKAPS